MSEPIRIALNGTYTEISDRARLALSADLGRAASVLAGWSGARLGQDTI